MNLSHVFGRYLKATPDRQGKRPWTPYELRRLGEMRSTGATLAGIATELNRTRNGVKAKIEELRKHDRNDT